MTAVDYELYIVVHLFSEPCREKTALFEISKEN